jgi:hypothetical protein
MKSFCVTIWFMSLVTFMFFASSTGGGAQESPPNTIEKAIAQAKSPAEREAIASFFRQEAANARTAADYHQQLADQNQKLKVAKPDYMAEVCLKMAADFRKIADAADRIADEQERFAKESERK